MTKVRVALLLLAALLGPACQLRLAVDVDVRTDGGGELRLVAAIDPELGSLLQDVGVDPTAGLDTLAQSTQQWSIDVTDDDAGTRVSLPTTFADPEDFNARVAALHEALDAADGRLFDRFELRFDEDGDLVFEGRAGLIPPTMPGMSGTGVAFDEDDLARLFAERGDELVRYDLRVRMPGEVIADDADAGSGTVRDWRLPVGEERDVFVEAAAHPPILAPALIATVLLIVAGTALGVVMLRTSRRNRQALAVRDMQALARL